MFHSYYFSVLLVLQQYDFPAGSEWEQTMTTEVNKKQCKKTQNQWSFHSFVVWIIKIDFVFFLQCITYQLNSSD